jgi:hypothetical protein
MTTLLLHTIATALVITLAGGNPTSVIAQADLCALLTEAEAEAILGKPLAAPEPQPGGDCWYPEQAGAGGGGEIILHVLPVQFDSKEKFHAFLVKEQKDADDKLKKAMARTGATITETTVEPVPEVGEPAYYADPSLFVLKGGKVLAIFAADRAQTVQVAAKAVPRFK